MFAIQASFLKIDNESIQDLPKPNVVACLWKARKHWGIPNCNVFSCFYRHSSSSTTAGILIRSSFLWDSRTYAAKREISLDWAMRALATNHSAPLQCQSRRSHSLFWLYWLLFKYRRRSQAGRVYNCDGAVSQAAAVDLCFATVIRFYLKHKKQI